jgi:NRPS condensation-like uncharacterized protein
MTVITADPLCPIVDGIGIGADTHLHVRIDLPAQLDAARLQAATLALSRTLPQLAGRYEHRWWRARWHVDPAPHWIIDEHHAVSEDRADALERALFALPFEPHGELPLRMSLLHMERHDRLLLRVNHLLADGGGTKNLCYRLAEAYRGITACPEHLPPAVTPAPLFLRALRGVRLRSLPAGLLNLLYELAANRPMSPICAPMGPRSGEAAQYRALHVDPARVRRLTARWRARGVTLNDLALAAFTRAVVLAFPQTNAQRNYAALVATADLRQYLPASRDVCNYSGLRPLVFRRLPLPDPERTVAAVRRATGIWKAGQTGMIAAVPMSVLAHLLPHAWLRAFIQRMFMRLSDPRAACAALTNIGPIDAEALDFGGGPALAARVLTPVAHSPLLITALTGCAGALDFSVAYREPQLATSDVERLVTLMDHELAALE